MNYVFGLNNFWNNQDMELYNWFLQSNTTQSLCLTDKHTSASVPNQIF